MLRPSAQRSWLRCRCNRGRNICMDQPPSWRSLLRRPDGRVPRCPGLAVSDPLGPCKERAVHEALRTPLPCQLRAWLALANEPSAELAPSMTAKADGLCSEDATKVAPQQRSTATNLRPPFLSMRKIWKTCPAGKCLSSSLCRCPAPLSAVKAGPQQTSDASPRIFPRTSYCRLKGKASPAGLGKPIKLTLQGCRRHTSGSKGGHRL